MLPAPKFPAASDLLIQASPFSKEELYSQLNYARIHTGGGNHALARDQRLRQVVWLGSVAHTLPGACELRMVEEVEELPADLQRRALGDFRRLNQRGIKVELAWS
jgi:hypothetical protein